MRYLGAALFVLMCSASASAQGAPPGAARMSADDVVARLMRFDRNKDFKIAIDELPERMQTLVVRGDRSDDLMLDVREIRGMTQIGPEVPILFPSPQFGAYGFGDLGTFSSRTHIENSIEDLRLAPQTAEEAKRIALAQVDEFEPAARAVAGQPLTDEGRAALITRLGSVLSEEERDNLSAALARRPLIKRQGLTALIKTVNPQGAINTASPAAAGR